LHYIIKNSHYVIERSRPIYSGNHDAKSQLRNLLREGCDQSYKRTFKITGSI